MSTPQMMLQYDQHKEQSKRERVSQVLQRASNSSSNTETLAVPPVQQLQMDAGETWSAQDSRHSSSLPSSPVLSPVSIELTPRQSSKFRAEAEAIFKAADHNANGSLSHAELKIALENSTLRQKLNVLKWTRFFEESDTNGDGEISLEEFCAYYLKTQSQDALEAANRPQAHTQPHHAQTTATAAQVSTSPRKHTYGHVGHEDDMYANVLNEQLLSTSEQDEISLYTGEEHSPRAREQPKCFSRFLSLCMPKSASTL
eukprot:TRINITY_DN5327_c0_g1_i7.p1 TRINITY_DN5327_c0_g1~~TRINITY_DN5327_c0_g1_i7.p1  ORF type:complete len:257 (-),score=47.99 TRINITY_DN5327_c0_g1_i7:280-1050(-)